MDRHLHPRPRRPRPRPRRRPRRRRRRQVRPATQHSSHPSRSAHRTAQPRNPRSPRASARTPSASTKHRALRNRDGGHRTSHSRRSSRRFTRNQPGPPAPRHDRAEPARRHGRAASRWQSRAAVLARHALVCEPYDRGHGPPSSRWVLCPARSRAVLPFRIPRSLGQVRVRARRGLDAPAPGCRHPDCHRGGHRDNCCRGRTLNASEPLTHSPARRPRTLRGMVGRARQRHGPAFQGGDKVLT